MSRFGRHTVESDRIIRSLGQELAKFGSQRIVSAKEALNHGWQKCLFVDPLKSERMTGCRSNQSHECELRASVSLAKRMNRIWFSEEPGSLSQNSLRLISANALPPRIDPKSSSICAGMCSG